MIDCGSDSQIPPIEVTDRRDVIGGKGYEIIARDFASHYANIIPIYAFEWEWSKRYSANSNVVLTINGLEVVESYPFCRKNPWKCYIEGAASTDALRAKNKTINFILYPKLDLQCAE
jgi:hypothetical protein